MPVQSVERLTQSVDRLSYLQGLWPSFWRGVMIGLGTTVGVALVLSMTGWLLNYLDFIPGISRATQIIESVRDY